MREEISESPDARQTQTEFRTATPIIGVNLQPVKCCIKAVYPLLRSVSLGPAIEERMQSEAVAVAAVSGGCSFATCVTAIAAGPHIPEQGKEIARASAGSGGSGGALLDRSYSGSKSERQCEGRRRLSAHPCPDCDLDFSIAIAESPGRKRSPLVWPKVQLLTSPLSVHRGFD